MTAARHSGRPRFTLIIRIAEPISRALFLQAAAVLDQIKRRKLIS